MRDVERMIGNLIDRQKIAFIGSADIEGFLNIKAMLQPRKRGGVRIPYSVTNTPSVRTTQYLKNHHACIHLCDSHSFRGVMLKGKMRVLTDNSTREMTWGEGDTLYYPLGVTDPDYCILKSTAITDRRYGSFSSGDFEVEQAVFNLRS